MLAFLLRLSISAGALYFIASASGGQIRVSNWFAAFFAALVLGVLNALIKPVLMFITGILTLPLSCLTLGLWTLILSWLMNAVLFSLAASAIGGFDVKSFPAALAGSLALSVVNAVASALLAKSKTREVR